MEEAAAGRASWGFVRLLPVLVLGLWSTLPTADFLEVEMAEKPQIVLLNDNATIFCKVPGSLPLDIKYMGIIWYQKSRVSKTESKLFEFFGDHQKAFRRGAIVSPQRLEMGDASLQLPAVQLSDAGEYRCEVVVTPEKAEGTVQVEVLAHPVSSLFLKQAMVNNSEDKVMLCKSSGFYPENINITWKRWTQKDPQYREVSDGIITGPTVKNEDGTYNVTSSLMLKPSLEDNVAIYQCEIWHISMTTSQKLNFTLTLTGKHPPGHFAYCSP
ncbi:PREDICTED: natural cytotoxicity triggering receptor 3 ligand 1 [Ceratotherium simum simum]|uniref:Natural cytotoxicity triggering receptor 3 ligand 1 n=1 Tax=Ceratotherium simum simum TaxID=73337 RepID=A0ABM1CRU0_CERSS|nr:PREDICTED: natural cytotoxicity triggering receptor 3 ligand 1 [Ceratotherium simum simum]